MSETTGTAQDRRDGTAVSGGPLDVGVGGSFAFTPPPDNDGTPLDRWSGSTLSILLCTTGAPITIENVEPILGSPAPVEARVLVRTTAAGQQVIQPTLFSALGTAPDFSEPYADTPPLSGDISDSVDGIRVQQKCDEKATSANYVELIVVNTSEATGSLIDGLEFRYTASGKTFRKLYDYQFVNCGTDPALKTFCEVPS